MLLVKDQSSQFLSRFAKFTQATRLQIRDINLIFNLVIIECN